MPSDPHLHLLFILVLAFTFSTSSSPLSSHSSSSSLSPPPYLPTKNLTLFGSAHFKNNTISLTQELSNCNSDPPSSSSKENPPNSGIGRAFYAYPIRFLDSSSNSTVSFSTRFTFTIIPSPPPCLPGDGIAFLITSNSNSYPRSDGYIGLPETPVPNPQDSSFLAVEFDTSCNPGLGDINDNHLGIDLDSITSVASIDLMAKGIDLKGGKEMTAWIEYRDVEKTIKVWVGYDQIRPESPILVVPIDLSKRFKVFMHVGFSASNGKGSAIHLIDDWHFKTFEFVSPTAPMETIGSKNCLFCYPDDPDTEEENEMGAPHNHHKDKRVLEWALGLLGLAALLISFTVFIVVLCMCLMKRRTERRKCNENGQIYRFQESRMPQRLKLAEIRSATKGFNQNRVIGEGASAIVYEANLPSCGNVAVKRFSQVNQNGSLGNQFATEFATMVGCLRHKNLVQLHGWCCERNELVLVYEYMPNGSLDKILHRRTNANKSLTFERRLNILLGVCSALIYLHEECERQIIHRDVKTCNIMLDAEFNAKLGDFGLAEVYEHSSRERDATLPAGTIGYLAPEYVYSGVPTVKTDVYSFGVVVLEVASGRRPVDEDGVAVTDWVWDLWEKRMLVVAADPNLMHKFDKGDMERMLMVGLICVHPNFQLRPTMKEAARMLRGMLLPELPALKPTVMIQSVMPRQDILARLGREEDEEPWSTPKTHFSRV